MDYSLLFAVERNVHFKGLKGPSRTTESTKSDDDPEANQLCKQNLLKKFIVLSKFDKTRHTYLS